MTDNSNIVAQLRHALLTERCPTTRAKIEMLIRLLIETKAVRQ